MSCWSTSIGAATSSSSPAPHPRSISTTIWISSMRAISSTPRRRRRTSRQRSRRRTSSRRAKAKAHLRPLVMVGDSPWDIESASRAGMPCVALLTGGYSERELLEAGAEAVFASLIDLRAGIGSSFLADAPRAGGHSENSEAMSDDELALMVAIQKGHEPRAGDPLSSALQARGFIQSDAGAWSLTAAGDLVSLDCCALARGPSLCAGGRRRTEIEGPAGAGPSTSLLHGSGGPVQPRPRSTVLAPMTASTRTTMMMTSSQPRKVSRSDLAARPGWTSLE